MNLKKLKETIRRSLIIERVLKKRKNDKVNFLFKWRVCFREKKSSKNLEFKYIEDSKNYLKFLGLALREVSSSPKRNLFSFWKFSETFIAETSISLNS